MTWYIHSSKQLRDDELPEELVVTNGNGTVEQVYVPYPGVCRDVCSSVSEFTCSVCGFRCDLMSWETLFDGDEGRHRHHHYGTPRYCPNCGRKVVE